MQLSLGLAGSNAPSPDFALFLAKAQAARMGIDHVLSILSAFETKVQQPITVEAADSGSVMQFAANAASFVTVPAQTDAVLTPAQVKQGLAWHATLTEQVRLACQPQQCWSGDSVRNLRELLCSRQPLFPIRLLRWSDQMCCLCLAML